MRVGEVGNDDADSRALVFIGIEHVPDMLRCIRFVRGAVVARPAFHLQLVAERVHLAAAIGATYPYGPSTLVSA